MLLLSRVFQLFMNTKETIVIGNTLETQIIIIHSILLIVFNKIKKKEKNEDEKKNQFYSSVQCVCMYV